MLPILFQNNSLIIYSYPLLMGLAWGIGYQVFFHHIENADRLRAQVLFWGLFASAWIGAKILFIITSSSLLTNEFLMSSNFWLGGGFVFYGGLLGGVLFLVLYHLTLKFEVIWIKWGVVALTLGHGIGRIGCFLAGCCYGEVTQMWWGIHLHGHDRHPTQLLEAISLVALSFYLKKMNDPRKIVGVYTISYGLLRYILEILRADKLRGIWALGLTPSQWFSIILVISGLYLISRQRQLISK